MEIYMYYFVRLFLEAPKEKIKHYKIIFEHCWLENWTQNVSYNVMDISLTKKCFIPPCVVNHYKHMLLFFFWLHNLKADEYFLVNFVSTALEHIEDTLCTFNIIVFKLNAITYETVKPQPWYYRLKFMSSLPIMSLTAFAFHPTDI